jgi:hypothetical protein
MALMHRIESLKKRHAEIDVRLHAETSHLAQDEDLIRRLKCQKLSLKDEMKRLLSSFEEQQAA